MPKLSVRRRMMSARLPGVSEPTLLSIPIAFAPSIVANSSTSRHVSLSSLSPPPASAWSKPRCVPIVARIVPKRWPPFEQQTSIERLGRTPPARRRAGRGPAVAHLHLDVGRDRCGAARRRHHLELVVGQRVAVHVGLRVVEQAALL